MLTLRINGKCNAKTRTVNFSVRFATRYYYIISDQRESCMVCDHWTVHKYHIQHIRLRMYNFIYPCLSCLLIFTLVVAFFICFLLQKINRYVRRANSVYLYGSPIAFGHKWKWFFFIECPLRKWKKKKRKKNRIGHPFAQRKKKSERIFHLFFHWTQFINSDGKK